MYSLVVAGILTIFIEFVIIWSFQRKEPLKLLFYSFLVNSFTLPLASYAYFYICSNLVMVEVLVVIIEVVFLKYLLNVGYKRAILISFAANLCTILAGILWGYI